MKKEKPNGPIDINRKSKEEIALEQEIEALIKERIAYQKQIDKEMAEYRKEQRKKEFALFSKVAIICLVIGVCWITLTQQSEANRIWWLENVEQMIGGENRQTVNNDENRVISGSEEEVAIAEIMEKTGVPMPMLKIKPTDMALDGYDYDEISMRGSMFYLYHDYVITVTGYRSGENASYSWSYDGEILQEDVIERNYGLVTISEMQAEGDTVPTVTASWTYHNHQYQIAGKLQFEEMKQIVENIFY